ncbi:polyphosphate kinase 2 family protein [Pseudodonghicola xiamenensis]|uniref:UDP-galactose-lipid carrier transferase n=1 Tax=Pseudodonghicola xiamenensis TaxID=337702 RepID=A0A8J3MD84_9RHOB|nr:polyphosphate kinase [Pseudodonghicola xiamenensis]GHG81402.1 UDP-galactose-lipid carrier transferase [Pseudodonghicola xiamenensis]
MTKDNTPHLDQADLSLSMDREAYEAALAELQLQLAMVQQAYLTLNLKAVIVFEGWDAAGKGGTIRRISQAFDPRSFKVWPIGAPRNYYLERHYLLRFMERLPPVGAISVFDRSWYGRVLVERVEELTPEARWRAAYDEIVSFEKALVADDTRVVKLFFHISQDEQMRRFEERLRNPLKRWKLSYEDFRNRGHWLEHEAAANEMFARTSWDGAPWSIIPSNNKKYGRIAAMRIILEALSDGVDLSPPPVDERLLKIAERELTLDPELIAGLRAQLNGGS